MNEKQLYRVLDHLAQRNLPEDIDLWGKIYSELEQPVLKTAYPLKQMTRFALIIMILLVSVFATVAFFQRNVDPGMQSVQELVTPINQSETQDDFTVTVEWAYADANRIFVAYQFKGNTDEVPERIDWGAVYLKDSRRNYSVSNALTSDITSPGSITYYAQFDATVVDEAPESLDLKLMLRPLRRLKPFIFNFSVPFIPAVMVETQKAVEVNGLKVWLERVSLTPSMIHTNLCYQRPDVQGVLWWYPRIEVEHNGKRVLWESDTLYQGYITVQDEQTLCREINFLIPPDETALPLTLKITRLQTPTYYSRESMEKAVEVYAKYGIEAEVIRNQGAPIESYMLKFAAPIEDRELFEHASEEAEAAWGTPLQGEWIEGPWVFTIDLP